MSFQQSFNSNVNGHTNLSGQNSRNTSSKEREKPLAFKRTSKKRSWVWDWFEQDQINKYRAICLYCHAEIFRTENDKGSPKKLETHLSKHNVTKDNYLDKDVVNLRNSKISLYGKINGRANRSVSFAPIQPTNLGPINNSNSNSNNNSQPQTPLINQSTFIPHDYEKLQSQKDVTPSSMQEAPPGPPQQQFSYQPIQSPPHNYQPMIPLQFQPPHPNQFFHHPPPSHPQIPIHLHHPHNPQFNQFHPFSQFDNQIIDPSLHNLNNDSITKNLLSNIDIDSINKYNYLVEKHNNFLENYNKSVIIKNNEDLIIIDKDKDDFANKDDVNKEFLKMTTPINENKSQKAIRDFITNNNLDLKILQDSYFIKMIEVIKENPYDQIK